MLPGSIDPRRPDKQQRYKPPPASNNSAPGEDLTPDYMNILDPQRKSMQTTCRSDRFKVVKIESTEPFKRGRWECMDFLDQSYNRVFQRNNNYGRQMSSDTYLRPISPNGSNDLHKCLTNNSDLQTSMLQIFYRQNNSIFDKNNTVCMTQLQQTVFECDKKYQNHVLRPGMVSSSLVGIKYPFELNFEKDDSSPSKENLCKNRSASVSDCHVNCDNQKFQSMSSDYSNLPVYPNLNQDLLNNGQYIENTAPVQQNYSQIYQEQIITYVDNCLPQRITTNTTEVYTTTLTPTTTDYNLNRQFIHEQPNIILGAKEQQLNQQLTKIIETPLPNIEVPQLLFNPNTTFQGEEQQYLPIHTESQIQSNLIYENDKMGSVISANSFENFATNNNEDYSIPNKFETELRPGLQEVFDPNFINQNTISTPTIIQNLAEPPVSQMPVYQEQIPTKPLEVDVSCVRSFLRDEKNLVACSAQQSNSSQSIDGKIEQLMDLVKKHLKFAVLEDVNDMKQQILILKGRVAQLEYENALLRSCEEKYKRQEHN